MAGPARRSQALPQLQSSLSSSHPAPGKTGHTSPYVEVPGFDNHGDPVLDIGPAASPNGGTLETGELLLLTG
jgi:hypothetical protein